MTRSAIVWISDYDRSIGQMPESRDAAINFADALTVPVGFSACNQSAFDELFEGANAQVRNVQIVYFAGHGTKNGPAFAVRNRDNGVAKHDQVSLGGGLAYAAFDCCLSLSIDRMKQWRGAFQGLHYLLGFGAFVQPSTKRGRRFAEFLRPPHSLPFPMAWRKAAMETEKGETPVTSWSSLRAIADRLHIEEDEVWPETELPRSGPNPPDGFVGVSEKLEIQLKPLPRPLFPDPVTLYRTRSPSSEALRALAATFDHAETAAQDAVGSSVFRSAASILDLYAPSGSYWWMRSWPRSRKLFKPPTPPPPTSNVALGQALEFLERMNLQDDFAVPSRITRTVEWHGSGAEDREELFTIAWHLDSFFQLADLLVMGPGAKMRVTVTGEGIGEAFKLWREPVEHGEVAVITVDEAERRLREAPAFAQLAEEDLKITGRRFGYYGLPPRERQDCLIPVYAFEGQITDDLIDYQFVRYVQATAPAELADLVKFPEDSVVRTMPLVFA
jgi:uncharacterized protein DUF6345